MEDWHFQTLDYLDSSVKNKIIDDFLKKKLIQLTPRNIGNRTKGKVKGKSANDKKGRTTNTSKSKLKISNLSRPCSAFSTKSACVISTSYYEDLPIELASAINSISLSFLKKIRDQCKLEKHEYLIYSFLLLFIKTDDTFEKNHGKMIRSKCLQTFSYYLNIPKSLTLGVQTLPTLIRDKKIPGEEVKKAVSWFSMANKKSSEMLIPLYNYVSQIILYAKKNYESEIFTIQKPENTFSSKSFRNISSRNRKSRNISKFSLKSNLKGDSRNKGQGSKKNEGNESMFFYSAPKWSRSKSPAPETDIAKSQRVIEKNSKFFLSSHINKKIHQSFMNFIKTKNSSADKSELIESFLGTLPLKSLENAKKYLDHFFLGKKCTKPENL